MQQDCWLYVIQVARQVQEQEEKQCASVDVLKLLSQHPLLPLPQPETPLSAPPTVSPPSSSSSSSSSSSPVATTTVAAYLDASDSSDGTPSPSPHSPPGPAVAAVSPMTPIPALSNSPTSTGSAINVALISPIIKGGSPVSNLTFVSTPTGVQPVSIMASSQGPRKNVSVKFADAHPGQSLSRLAHPSPISRAKKDRHEKRKAMDLHPPTHHHHTHTRSSRSSKKRYDDLKRSNTTPSLMTFTTTSAATDMSRENVSSDITQAATTTTTTTTVTTTEPESSKLDFDFCPSPEILTSQLPMADSPRVSPSVSPSPSPSPSPPLPSSLASLSGSSSSPLLPPSTSLASSPPLPCTLAPDSPSKTSPSSSSSSSSSSASSSSFENELLNQQQNAIKLEKRGVGASSISWSKGQTSSPKRSLNSSAITSSKGPFAVRLTQREAEQAMENRQLDGEEPVLLDLSPPDALNNQPAQVLNMLQSLDKFRQRD
eukprot:g65541.t1